MTENKIITYNNVLNPLDRTILASGEYKNIDEILKELIALYKAAFSSLKMAT